jgi:hypothetical protein
LLLYYAVVTLNQMVLSHNASKAGWAALAKTRKLYFTLFRLVLNKGDWCCLRNQKAANIRRGEEEETNGKREAARHKASKPKHGAFSEALRLQLK